LGRGRVVELLEQRHPEVVGAIGVLGRAARGRRALHRPEREGLDEEERERDQEGQRGEREPHRTRPLPSWMVTAWFAPTSVRTSLAPDGQATSTRAALA